MTFSKHIAQVSSLQVFPIKSCGPIPCPTLPIERRGGRWDREWMIVDAASGLFLTQRQSPSMTLIHPSLTETSLVVQAGATRFSVPLTASGNDEETSRDRITVRLWNDDCQALDEGDEAARILSDHLARPVRLVRLAPEFHRHLPEKYGLPGSETGFADTMPFLLTNEESLEDLNTRLGTRVPMDRFRANIVIRDAAAFSEDTWKKIRIGDSEFTVTKPCSRCVIINTDQTSGARGPEPLKTLASYRRVEGNKVLFGMYLVHDQSGVIRIGDPVEIMA